MTTQALQDNILFQNGYLVNGIWKTLDTTFDVLNPATGGAFDDPLPLV